jgi:hypothetical protein
MTRIHRSADANHRSAAAANAIAASVREDRIVTIPYDPTLEDELIVLAEDSATHHPGGMVEFWGWESGASWRVHLEKRGSR